MSGTRVVWNDGDALASAKMQQVADVAASSEDRVWNVLLTPEFSLNKAVYPLLHETGINLTYNQGRALVYPGTVSGGIRVLPAFYIIGGPGFDAVEANTTELSARAGVLDLPPTSFPTSSTSNGRTATVYAWVRRETTTGPRKVKDIETGQVSTQTIDLFSTATVTIHAALGPEDGTFAAPTLPADSSASWYVPLANVRLDDGAGGPWTQGTAIAQTRITQTWPAGWMKRNRIQFARPASIMSDTYSAGANGRTQTPLSERWGASISVCAALQHKTDGTGVFKTIDANHDWSRRMVRIELVSVIGDPDNAGARGTAPDDTTLLPLQADFTVIQPHSSVAFTAALPFPGYVGVRRLFSKIFLYEIPDLPNPPIQYHLNLYLRDDRSIEAEFTGPPYDYNGTTPVYLLRLEASDRFVF